MSKFPTCNVEQPTTDSKKQLIKLKPISITIKGYRHFLIFFCTASSSE